ncbi:MAG: ABC transporter substrate-binding protein [Oscillospiraceae bacterium]|jgi:NitT/TauT family transport system substrate-binding protein|nr:ABC transporter substrate-binding protein [Oscillospiraceae bacterium]
MIFKKAKITINLFFLFILTFILCSCSDNSNNNYKKIKISEATRSIFYCPQYVAMSLGFFEEEGLKIDLVTSEGSDKAMTCVLSEQSDIALMGSEMVAYVCSGGRENFPILFSQLTKKDGSFLVGRQSLFRWSDLKGKTIIGGRKGGLPEMTLEHVLRKNGLEPNVDVGILNNIKLDLMGSAFLSGTGDYVMLFEPIASSFESTKNCNVLESLGNNCGEITYTCYCASQKYLKKNKETIEKFTRALYKAQTWVRTHNSTEIAHIISPYFVNTNIELIERAILRCSKVGVWSETPVVNKNAFDLMQQIAAEAGELKQKIDFNKVVDNQYALAATM